MLLILIPVNTDKKTTLYVQGHTWDDPICKCSVGCDSYHKDSSKQRGLLSTETKVREMFGPLQGPEPENSFMLEKCFMRTPMVTA